MERHKKMPLRQQRHFASTLMMARGGRENGAQRRNPNEAQNKPLRQFLPTFSLQDPSGPFIRLSALAYIETKVA
jgi:hypothetical protein